MGQGKRLYRVRTRACARGSARGLRSRTLNHLARTRPTGRGPLHFRVLGDDQHPTNRLPVVLVHGVGMSHRSLSRLHDELAADSRVFSVDLPGFAGLPKPGDVDIATMATALGDVIAALDVGPAILVGHSMGAQWVVEVARQRPDLAAHVVVIGPVVDDRHRTLPAQMRALALDTLGETPNTNAIVFTDYLRCGMAWYLAQVRHMLAYPTDERVADLTMPLLVIRGEHDPVAGLRWCRRLRDSAAAGALAIIPGRHHVTQHTAPKAVAAAIRAHTEPRPAP